jgi:membrane protein YqaA with SNARE-associated domain
MKHFFSRYPSTLTVIPIAVFSLLIAVLSPEEILGFVGVENAYALMFLVSLIGGLTIFSAVPYPVLLLTFAAGGLNPLALGVACASGLMLGDSTSYYIGYRGKALLNGLQGVPQRVFRSMQRLYSAKPRWVPPLIFLYGALVPLPNDIITLSAGLSRFPFWRTMIPLALGNLIFAVGLAYFAEYLSAVFL